MELKFNKRNYLQVVQPTYEYEKMQTTLRLEQQTRDKLDELKAVSGLSRGMIIDMLVAIAPVNGSLPKERNV